MDELFELEFDELLELELDELLELEFDELLELEFDELFELEFDELFELEFDELLELEFDELLELEFEELLPANCSSFGAGACSNPRFIGVVWVRRMLLMPPVSPSVGATEAWAPVTLVAAARAKANAEPMPCRAFISVSILFKAASESDQ